VHNRVIRLDEVAKDLGRYSGKAFSRWFRLPQMLWLVTCLLAR
jgi:hypothetical protein